MHSLRNFTRVWISFVQLSTDSSVSPPASIKWDIEWRNKMSFYCEAALMARKWMKRFTKAEEDKSITGGQTWKNWMSCENVACSDTFMHFCRILLLLRRKTAQWNLNLYFFFPFVCGLTDRSRLGCLTGASRRRPGKRLLKSSHRQSPGAARAESTHQLHELLGDGSRGELGSELIAPRRSFRRDVWRNCDAIWAQKSSSFNVLAIFIIMDFNRVREISWDNVHDRFYWRLLLCNCLNGYSGELICIIICCLCQF